MKIIYTITSESGPKCKSFYVKDDPEVRETIIKAYIANAISDYCGIKKKKERNEFWTKFTQSNSEKWFVNDRYINDLSDEKVIVDFIYLKECILPKLDVLDKLKKVIIDNYEKYNDSYQFDILKNINSNSKLNGAKDILKIKYNKLDKNIENNIEKAKEIINFTEDDFEKIEDFYKNYLADYYNENIFVEIKEQSYEEVTNKVNMISHFNLLDCDTEIKIQSEDIISFIPFEYKEHEELGCYLFDEIYKKTNKKILTGDSGSGKSQIAYSLYLNAHEKAYYVEYININNLSEDFIKQLKKISKQNIFIVIETVDLDINKQNIYLNQLISLVDQHKQIKVLITAQNNSEIMKLNFLKNIEKLQIIPLDIKDKPLIKTFTDYLIIKDMPEESLRGDYYHKYVISHLDKIAAKKYFDDMARLAFLSFDDQIRIKDLKRYDFKADFIDFVSSTNNFIYTDINKQELICFNSLLIKDFLASEYILSSLQKPDFNEKTKNVNFKGYKWQSAILFIAEKFDRNILEHSEKISKAVLYHLRTLKELDQINKVIKIINSSESIEPKMSMDISKHYYSSADYKKSILYAIEALKSEDDKSEIYNHLASCFLDLYMPDISLKLCDTALKLNNSKDYRANIKGNMARALLRLGDYQKAKENFQEKLNLHQDKINDILRDKNDLILVNSYIFQKTKNYDLYSESKKIFEEVIENYKIIEKEKQISQETNIVYSYRNMSYFLPYINKDILEENNYLIDYITQKSDNLYVKSIKALSCLNLVKVFIQQDEKIKAKNILDNIINILNDSDYRVETYIAYLLYNSIDNDKYIDEAKKLYQEIKDLAEICFEYLTKADIEKFDIIRFILPDPDKITNIDDIFIF